MVTPGYRAANVGELYDGPPGGYCPVTSVDTGKLVLWIKDPVGHVGRCVTHTITEHEDGTVSVSPSILATIADHGHDWHGYLERGVWRSV